MKEELENLKAQIHFKENGIPSIHAGYLTDETIASIINLVDKELPEKIKYTGDEILGIKIAISEHLVAKGFGIHSIKEIDAYNKAIDDMRAKLKGVNNGRQTNCREADRKYTR